MSLLSPFHLDGRFTGVTPDDLRDWATRRADRHGHIDLVRTKLPSFLDEAWRIEGDGFDVYPLRPTYAGIDADTGEVEIHYRAQIPTVSGLMGRLTRIIKTADRSASHSIFSLPQEHWSGGHGKRIMRRSAELYWRLGLEQIDVTALDLGRYLWPMCGFRSATSADHANTVQAIREFARDLKRGDLDDEDFEHLWDYGELSWTPKGRRIDVTREQIEEALADRNRRKEDINVFLPPSLPLAHALLIWNPQLMWPGVFDLTDEERGVRQLDAYTHGV